jgi:pyruvate formate lyase activating enzyme
VSELHEARYYEKLDGERVRCTLCPHACRIPDGGRGACGVRVNHHGVLNTLVYERIAARHVEPVEKKPFFHVAPGSLAYSIGTVGCNLRCSFCINAEISQWAIEHVPTRLEWETDDDPAVLCPQLVDVERAIPGERVSPRDIVDAALDCGAVAVAYTYTEPTIFFELVIETARLAREAGLLNLLVSNGFTSEAPVRELAVVVDAANIDLKFASDTAYRHTSRARLQPILDAIRLYRELGVWLELTTLVIPGLNDADDELRWIAGFIASLGTEVPWHVSQFHPHYRMQDRPPTPVETLHRARQIGGEVGLRYVYEGNVPGAGGENTSCHACGALLIERWGFVLRSNRIRDGRCPDCGEAVAGLRLSRDR